MKKIRWKISELSAEIICLPGIPRIWTIRPLWKKRLPILKAAGGRSLVEMSVPGIRGDIRAVKTIAQNTGVNVIGTTGIYIYESWPEWCHEAEIKDFMNFMEAGDRGRD